MKSKQRCSATTGSGFGLARCTNTAKYGSRCGVHASKFEKTGKHELVYTPSMLYRCNDGSGKVVTLCRDHVDLTAPQRPAPVWPTEVRRDPRVNFCRECAKTPGRELWRIECATCKIHALVETPGYLETLKRAHYAANPKCHSGEFLGVVLNIRAAVNDDRIAEATLERVAGRQAFMAGPGGGALDGAPDWNTDPRTVNLLKELDRVIDKLTEARIAARPDSQDDFSADAKKALAVLVNTGHIRQYLATQDPKALEQAEAVVKASDPTAALVGLDDQHSCECDSANVEAAVRCADGWLRHLGPGGCCGKLSGILSARYQA